MTVYNKLMVLFIWGVSQCLPYDDGKYYPEKYKTFDDGKYYRPLSEGKYIPGDEGRYTYVYKQGLYPEDDGDYRYIHQVGPEGGFGGNGGFGGDGGYGGTGGFGGKGDDGPGGPNHLGSSGNPYKPNKIEYIGRKTYASRYPYIHKLIKALVNEYVSSDILAPEGSAVHSSKVYADKEVAVKCHYLTPPDKKNISEFVTQFPPRLAIKEGEKTGSYYSFQGTKLLNRVDNALTNKLKVEFEVFVRILDEVTDNTENVK